jgi:Uma2 family endonuclease
MVTVQAPTTRYTIDDLADFPDDGKLRELVDGRIVEWDVPNWQHGLFEMELGSILRNFAREHHLGLVASGEVMSRLRGSRHNARGSDIEFRRRGHVPREDANASATLTVPDMVVELLSPSDRADRVLEKIHDWMTAGVHLLWYIDLETGNTTVYQGGHVSYITAEETLDGGDVLPGFQIRLRDLLDGLREAME